VDLLAPFTPTGQSVAAFDHEIDTAKHFLFAIDLATPAQFSHDAARRAWAGEEKLMVFLLQAVRCARSFQLLDTALHLFGLGGLVAERFDEDFELLDTLRWLR